MIICGFHVFKRQCYSSVTLEVRNLSESFFFFDGGGQAVFKGSIFGCNDDMDLEFNSCIL